MRPAPARPPIGCPCNTGRASMRRICSAGMSPQRSAVATAATRPQAASDPDHSKSNAPIETPPGSTNRPTTCNSQTETSRPASEPLPASRNVSVRKSRSRRNRLTPRATRIAASPRRCSFRASISPARFAHPTRSTRPTTATSRPTKRSVSARDRNGRAADAVGTSVTASDSSAAERGAASAVSAASARAARTPGLSFPVMEIHSSGESPRPSIVMTVSAR